MDFQKAIDLYGKNTPSSQYCDVFLRITSLLEHCGRGLKHGRSPFVEVESPIIEDVVVHERHIVVPPTSAQYNTVYVRLYNISC